MTKKKDSEIGDRFYKEGLKYIAATHPEAKKSDEDVVNAIKCFEIAAKNGNLNAALGAANLLVDGKYIAKNWKKAAEFYNIGNNDPLCLYKLGSMYYRGDDKFPADYTQALEILRKAAKLGSQEATLMEKQICDDIISSLESANKKKDKCALAKLFLEEGLQETFEIRDGKTLLNYVGQDVIDHAKMKITSEILEIFNKKLKVAEKNNLLDLAALEKKIESLKSLGEEGKKALEEAIALESKKDPFADLLESLREEFGAIKMQLLMKSLNPPKTSPKTAAAFQVNEKDQKNYERN
jgi:TPR repeat protein